MEQNTNNPLNQPISNSVPVVEQQPKQSNFLVILLSTLLIISVAISGFFAFQTQKLVKELTLLRAEPTPIATEVLEVDPTASWKIYKYNNLFEIKVPQELKVNDRGYGHIQIGDFLTVGVYAANPEDCRGDCSIIDTKISKIVKNIDTRYLTGWWGDVGGNVGQAYTSYVILHNNQYIYLQMQELPFSTVTRPVGEKNGSVSAENTKLLDQVLSTFKFLD